MKKCPNHPQKNAEFVCHNCGMHYCEDCLSVAGEFYYCQLPDCLAKFSTEVPELKIEEEFTCPNCSAELTLIAKEIAEKKVHCPECESFIDLSQNPPVVFSPKDYIKIVSTNNLGDVALIKSIFNDAEIDYYIAGENFLTIGQLAQNAIITVVKDQFDMARELLKDFEFHVFGVSAKNEETDE